MTLVRRVARPLLAAMFVTGGFDALRNPGPRAAKAEKVTPALNRLVPQLPDDTETLVRLNGAVQLAGGLLLASNNMTRLSATALAVTLVPTTAAGHRYWEETDQSARANQRLHFIKNLGLFGGLILAAVDTEGEPGLAWRAKHAGGELQSSSRRAARRARREAKSVTHDAKREAKLLRAQAKAKLGS